MSQLPAAQSDDFDPARDLPGFDVGRAKRYARIRLAIGTGAAATVDRAHILVCSIRRLRTSPGA